GRISAAGLSVDLAAPAVVDSHDGSPRRLHVELYGPGRGGGALDAHRPGNDEDCWPLDEGHEAVECTGLAAPVLHEPAADPGLEGDSGPGTQAVRPPFRHPQQGFEDVLPRRLDPDLLPALAASREYATSTLSLSHAVTPYQRDRFPRCPSCDAAAADVHWFRHGRNAPMADTEEAPLLNQAGRKGALHA